MNIHTQMSLTNVANGDPRLYAPVVMCYVITIIMFRV